MQMSANLKIVQKNYWGWVRENINMLLYYCGSSSLTDWHDDSEALTANMSKVMKAVCESGGQTFRFTLTVSTFVISTAFIFSMCYSSRIVTPGGHSCNYIYSGCSQTHLSV